MAEMKIFRHICLSFYRIALGHLFDDNGDGSGTVCKYFSREICSQRFIICVGLLLLQQCARNIHQPTGCCWALFIIDFLRCCFMFQFFLFFFQSPPKGATIPYRPKPQVNGPVILANGQAYTIQGNFAVPTEQVKCAIYS